MSHQKDAPQFHHLGRTSLSHREVVQDGRALSTKRPSVDVLRSIQRVQDATFEQLSMEVGCQRQVLQNSKTGSLNRWLMFLDQIHQHRNSRFLVQQAEFQTRNEVNRKTGHQDHTLTGGGFCPVHICLSSLRKTALTKLYVILENCLISRR